MCFPFNTIEPQTQKAKQSKTQLQFLCLGHVIVAFLIMFIYKDIAQGIFEFLCCLILYLTWTQLSYTLCLFYIVIECIFSIIKHLVLLLTLVQNGSPIMDKTDKIKSAQHILSFFLIAFYLFATYIAFQAYKQFKGEYYDNGGQVRYADQDDESQQNNNQSNTYQNYNYAQAPPAAGATNNSTNSNGYFQGRGVRIG